MKVVMEEMFARLTHGDNRQLIGHISVKSGNKLQLTTFHKETLQQVHQVVIGNIHDYLRLQPYKAESRNYLFDVFDFQPPNGEDAVLYWQKLADKLATGWPK